MDIAILGAGRLGRGIARRLLGFEDPIVVYNRTRDKAAPLEQVGARLARSARQAVESSRCVILALADADATRAVLLPPGAPQMDLSGRAVVQMGTISPADSEALGAEVEKRGGEYLEAPVLGSTPEAEAGELVLMAGCRPDQFDRWRFLFERLSERPRRVGGVGAASAFKLALNQLLVAQMAAISLSLGIVTHHGVDADSFMTLLGATSLHAPHFDKKVPRMLERDFSQPHFTTRLLLKDVELILDDAAALGLDASAMTGVRKVVERALDKGWAEADYSAIYDVINPE